MMALIRQTLIVMQKYNDTQYRIKNVTLSMTTHRIQLSLVTEQHTLKSVNNYLNTSIYSYLKTSGSQSSNLYFNVVHFFNTSVNYTSGQLETVVFLHLCLIRAVLMVIYGEHFKASAGNTKGGRITVPLTSCLTGLDYPVLQIKNKKLSVVIQLIPNQSNRRSTVQQ